MKKKFEITSLKHYYFVFAAVAILLSLIILYLIRSEGLPYTFNTVSVKPAFNLNYGLPHDFDKDGISEMCFMGKAENPNRKNMYLSVRTSSGSFIEQFNFYSYFNPDQIFFGDFNNDNYDDIFVLSQLKDSLFLSIINLKTRKFYVERQKIITKPDSAKRNFWDITPQPVGLLDNNGKQFIFTVKAGFSLFPRAVYSYDLRKKKIIRSFPTKANLNSHPLITDFTGDGKKEIILTAGTTGNMPDTTGYHDYTCWIFVLNKDLKPIFKPASFGRYPNVILENFPGLNKLGGKKIYFAFADYSVKHQEGKILSIDGEGKIETVRKFDEPIFAIYAFKSGNKPRFLISNYTGGIFLLNKNFKTLVKVDNFLRTEQRYISDVYEINDLILGKRLFFTAFFNTFMIFDSGLKLLAKKIIPNDKIMFYTRKGTPDLLKLNGKNKKPEIVILGQKNKYLFTLEENYLFKYSGLIFVGSSVFLFFLFVGTHRLNVYLATYISYFTHSLQRSNKGIVIIDHSGRVTFINPVAKRILKINRFERKAKFQSVLEKYPPFLNAITGAFEARRKYATEVTYSTPHKEFKGEISITPFKSFAGFTYSYLVEITDYTQPLLTDRSRVWGSTVQRIAHEIKTPLSTIQLNLKTLEMHLANENIANRMKYEGDISLMRTELERIKELLKNFLKFTNLDKSTPLSLDLNELLSESLKQFISYTSKGIEIVWNLDERATHVQGEKYQLIQLFHLVIENAIDAMNGFGKIEIITKFHEYLNEKNGRNYVEIKIKDNGPGIPEEIKELVFEPYFTTKKDGTGLGLALARKIIEDHNGMIEIESIELKGTIIKLYLPVENGMA